MPSALEDYRTRGCAVFEPDPAIADWARAVAPIAARMSAEDAHAHWWRCAGTWFAGVNILPNDGRGAVGHEVPPLGGAALDFIRRDLGHADVVFDQAQLSIVTQGYPAHGDEESEAAWRYRIKRCAAHVDGLERVMPGRRRKLSETHGFLLGIPLGDAGVEEGAFVVWEGSHEIMRAAFSEAYCRIDPQDWRSLDITDVYTEARRRVFETCPTVELAPGIGCAYVMHPLALHGVAPWRVGKGASRAVAYFRPDPFNGDARLWLTA